MEVVCPYCGTRGIPSPEGICPGCQRLIRDVTADPAPHADSAGGPSVEADRAGQSTPWIGAVGTLWTILGVVNLLFYPALKPLWSLVWLGLGVLACFRQVWAVGIGLVLSYLTILSLVVAAFSPLSLPPPLVVLGVVVFVGLLMAHYALYRAAKQRRSHADDRSLRADMGCPETPLCASPNQPGPPPASQAVQPPASSDDTVTPAGVVDQQLAGSRAEGSAAATESPARPLRAVLIFGGVATLVVGFLLISHFAIAPPADRFKDFTDTVETRLQRPQAGFAFGKLTRSTAGINTFNIAAIRVEATRQSDHASVAFKFQYLFEEGHWRLEDAEVSGDEAAKEAAENELARGSESDLLAVFAPVDGPRFAFYRNRARAGVAEGEYDRAIACCNEALRLGPRDAELHLLRGSALAAKGEFEEAVADCSEALRLEPGNACAFSLRGAAWADMRDYDKAHQDCGEALRLDPKAAIAWAIRAAVWLQEGDYGKAIEDANQALQADPYLAWAYSIRGTGRLKNLIEFGSAVEDCRTAIRLDPDEAWNYQSLAQIQATCPDGTYRDAAAALENANQAMTLLKASDIGRWRVVDTLAAAYAEGGQFDQAVEWQNKAIELLAKDQYATDQDKAELRSRLELYKQGKPYRQEPKKQ